MEAGGCAAARSAGHMSDDEFRRLHEGATRMQVEWDSLKPVALGLAVGTGAALLAGRAAASALFFGVSPQDPIALVGVAVILLVSASLAVLAPTRRAAAVDAALILKQ